MTTHHLTPDFNNQTTHFEEYNKFNQIRVGNSASFPIKHIGSSTLLSHSKPLTLKHILHVPSIEKNLVSVSKFTKVNNVFLEFHSYFFV